LWWGEGPKAASADGAGRFFGRVVVTRPPPPGSVSDRGATRCENLLHNRGWLARIDGAVVVQNDRNQQNGKRPWVDPAATAQRHPNGRNMGTGSPNARRRTRRVMETRSAGR